MKLKEMTAENIRSVQPVGVNTRNGIEVGVSGLVRPIAMHKSDADDSLGLDSETGCNRICISYWTYEELKTEVDRLVDVIEAALKE